ncbi:MAG TPA: hypothetical protein VFI79_05485, partial [Gemmatimonadales bacterium]|nr:hypothetical protein [Gemmatimonadales bacterium]
MASKADGRPSGRAVGTLGGLAVLVAAAVGLSSARPSDRPSADIHSEYVKYPSGKDTLTAY